MEHPDFSRRSFLKSSGALVAAGYSRGAAAQSATALRQKDNSIVKENAKEGTVEWQLQYTFLDNPPILRGYPMNRFLRCSSIEGYTAKTSYYPGESIDFYVSTDREMNFVADIYRLGHYGGKGGRHMVKLGPHAAKPQPVPLMTMERLRECSWEKSTSFAIPAEWTSGVYVAKLTREEKFGVQSYIVFVVKTKRQADFLFQVSDLTWQAYNKWPGNDSLYDDGLPQVWYNGPNVRVSFDRPYSRCIQGIDSGLTQGSGEFLIWEFPLVFWLEAEGYDVAYCSNVDIEQDPEVLKRCKAFLSVGHDEYWSRKMFNQVTVARDAGVSVGFFSGNSICQEIIFYDSAITGYPARAFARKARFQDEDTLMGVKTYGFAFGDWVVTKADSWIYERTGVKNGDYIPGLVGFEFHGTPRTLIRGLEVVASSELLHCVGGDVIQRVPSETQKESRHSAVVYPCPKGNWVFNAGSIWWSDGLSSPPGHVPARVIHVAGNLGIDRRVQQITGNVLNRFITDSPFKW
jgi:hypothetical protein